MNKYGPDDSVVFYYICDMSRLVHKSEEEKLKERLAMTHEQRFRLMMKLYRLGRKMQRAEVKTVKHGHSG